MLKKLATNYKTACISYNSKGNDKLRKDLTSIALSVVKRDQSEELGRQIPAKYSNIQKKLSNVIKWFDGKNYKNDVIDSENYKITNDNVSSFSSFDSKN